MKFRELDKNPPAVVCKLFFFYATPLLHNTAILRMFGIVLYIPVVLPPSGIVRINDYWIPNSYF